MWCTREHKQMSNLYLIADLEFVSVTNCIFMHIIVLSFFMFVFLPFASSSKHNINFSNGNRGIC